MKDLCLEKETCGRCECLSLSLMLSGAERLGGKCLSAYGSFSLLSQSNCFVLCEEISCLKAKALFFFSQIMQIGPSKIAYCWVFLDSLNLGFVLVCCFGFTAQKFLSLIRHLLSSRSYCQLLKSHCTLPALSPKGRHIKFAPSEQRKSNPQKTSEQWFFSFLFSPIEAKKTSFCT